MTIDPKRVHNKLLDALSFASLKEKYLLPFITDESSASAFPNEIRRGLGQCVQEFEGLNTQLVPTQYKRLRSVELLTDMHRFVKSYQVPAELYKGFGDVIEELGINPKDEGFLVAVEYAKRISEENNELMLMCPDNIIEQSLNTPQEKK